MALAPLLALFVTLAADVISAVIPAIQAMMPAFTDAVAAFTPFLTLVAEAAMTILPVLLESLIPLVPPLLELASALLDIAVQVLPVLIPLIADLADQLAGELAAALPDLVPVILLLVETVADLLPELIPLIPVVVDLAVSLLPLVEVVTDLLVAFGPNLVSAITVVAEGLTKFIEFLTQNKAATVATLVAITGVLAALTFTMVVNAAVSAFWAIAAAAAWLAAFAPVILIVAAIAAAVYLVIKYWDDIVAAAQWVWEKIKEAFGKIVDFFMEIGPKIWEGIQAIVGFLLDLPVKLVEAMVDVWSKVLDLGGNLVGKILEGIKAGASKLWEWFKGLPGYLWDGISNAVLKVGDIGRNILVGVWNGIMSFADKFFGWFRDLPGNIWNLVKGLANVLTTPFKLAFNGIAWLWNNTIGKLSFRLPDWIPVIGGKGFDVPDMPTYEISFPGLATGGTIAKAGIAMVGESGPELVRLPTGAQVYPTTDLAWLQETSTRSAMSMLAGMVGTGTGFGGAPGNATNVRGGDVVFAPGSVVVTGVTGDPNVDRRTGMMLASGVAATVLDTQTRAVLNGLG